MSENARGPWKVEKITYEGKTYQQDECTATAT